MNTGRQAHRRVGVRDVARLAGVSAQTVSRVLNDDPRVRDSTRRRVREAMASLDYRVNNAARALGTSRSRTLGIIVSDSALYGPTVGVTALETAARAAGRWIVSAYADATDDASVDDAARHLAAQGVDGVVLVAQNARTAARLDGDRLGVPVIAMHHGVGAGPHAEGARMVVAHLAAIGHRRLARVGGPADWAEEAARATGFDEALAAHGLVATHRWRGNWSAASGARLGSTVAAVLRAADPPTAIVVANDQMALGLMARLQASGCRVPHDVSITGFDDTPETPYYSPPLTSIRVDIAAEARRCVALVLGRDVPAPSRVAARLVVRGSTAAPRG